MNDKEKTHLGKLLKINAGDMHRNGHVFYLSDNDVWLTDHVPPTFLVK